MVGVKITPLSGIVRHASNEPRYESGRQSQIIPDTLAMHGVEFDVVMLS